MTWVVADHTATPGSRELTVSKGQQVEVLESSSGSEWSLVRLPATPGQSDPPAEGLVPSSALKQPPQTVTACKTSPSKKSPNQSLPHAQQATNLVPDDDLIGSDGCGTTNTSSPGNKRRGFSKKWLTQPLRKLSQSKVDKSSSSGSSDKSATGSSATSSPFPATSDRPPPPPPLPPSSLTPSGSKKHQQHHHNSTKLHQEQEPRQEQNGGAEDIDDELELPPPMKPITEPATLLSVAATPAPDDNHHHHHHHHRLDGLGKPPMSSMVSDDGIKQHEGPMAANLEEIEQIVKEKMEQHSHERNSADGQLTSTRVPLKSFSSNDSPVCSVSMATSAVPTTTASSTSTSLSMDSEYGGGGARPGTNSSSFNDSTDDPDLPTGPNSAAVSGAKRTEDIEATALRKRQFVIKELVDTERDYVNDLRQIVEGYMALMRDQNTDIPPPEDLRGGKEKMVFGNVEAIYEWHRDFFLKSLEACIEQPEELGPLFKRYERKLHMYVVYCQNKPVSEYIVSEHIDGYFKNLQERLGHRLRLCDLLIKPVQRITKYQLLLREVLRLTERTLRTAEIEGLRAALHIMRVIPKQANDMMDVGRLQGFDGKITAQGKLLLHGPMMVAEIQSVPSRPREWQVFLFEQKLIFSETLGKKTQFTNPNYIYKDHIQVNKMSLEDWSEDSEKFVIRSTDPQKLGPGYVCGAADEGPKRQEWIDTLTAILQTHRDFLKAIQSPIAYQKELTKDPLRGTTPEPVTSAASSTSSNLPVSGIVSKERNESPKKSQPSNRLKSGSILDQADFPRTPSPTKSKLNFLEGFRNTLRSRSPVRVNTVPVAPGTKVKLAADWGTLRAGEELVVRRLEANGLIVFPPEVPKQENWIPASIISNSAVSRAWSFRPRKLNSDKSLPVENKQDNGNYNKPAPFVSSAPTPVRANVGDVARLVVQISQGEATSVTWRQEGANMDIQENDKYKLQQAAGFFCLEINRCRMTDSGPYCCRIQCENGSCSARIYLTVSGGIGGLGGTGTTWARVLDSTRIEVDWEEKEIGRCDVEYRSMPSTNWTTALENIERPPVILDLLPGASYSFRVVSKNGNISSASPIVNLPLGDCGTAWEAEQFVARYLELDELGKGRFATVRRARDRGTGQEVALKQTHRQKQSRSLTRAEYELIASTRHGNIVRALALFENAPQLGVDTIVLELVRGPTLLTYLSRKPDYTESMASNFAGQLLSALQWLHRQNKAHLLIKPEDILVDQDTGIVKLIDLGEAVRGPVDEVVPPADLEFAAPESVLGRPVGIFTDMWAAGVFIYVLLSGLSPFLDDSVEETTTNILKCDYCFPHEYFESISNEAKTLLSRLLCQRGEDRISAEESLNSPWFRVPRGAKISSSRMAAFMERRSHSLKSPRDHCNHFQL